jgi:predicted ATPase/class 3 adenylate cyclase
METTSAYLPADRRLALARGEDLPQAAPGAVLFVDISGFTPLTNLLVQRFGPRRGADELTRQLNAIYSALIAEVERYGGQVIGFSGDGITCWFADQPGEVASGAHCALTGAQQMQQIVRTLRGQEIAAGVVLDFAIKTAIASGVIQRYLVGDPAIQVIEVLAGAPLDRVAAAEQVAQRDEMLLDEATATALAGVVTAREWRRTADGAPCAVVTALRRLVSPRPQPSVAPPLPEALIKPWVLPAVYERLQGEQGRFLAELRPATALFLRFSGLDYDHDPAAGTKLDAYIRWVQRVVQRYQGALIQLTTGDKGSYLYATFGAPLAHDDNNQRAAAAALDLRTPPDELAFITATQIGISQGMMRVGAYGSPTRRTYGVLGEETSIAARLMSRAEPGQILVGATVAESIGEEFRLVALGQVILKGKSTPQAIFAVTGRREQSTAQVSQRYTAPLVGRSAELAQLDAVLRQVLGGSGQVVRISGGAGLGKSHLAATFAGQAAAQELAVVAATCQSTSQDVAYAAARQLMCALFNLTAEMPPERQIAHLESALEALNPAWLMRLPLLGDLLGLSMPDNPTTATFEPRLRQEALIGLTVEIVQAHARQQPRLLLFEDIHWMDEASQGVLLALARAAASVPLLLLLVQRPATREGDRFLAEVAALPNQHLLELSELAPEGLAALVGNRLRGAIAPLALALIQVQTQGNPFFAEELVDALCDAGKLVNTGTVWDLAPTLLEALRARDCLRLGDGGWRLAPDASLATVDLGLPSTVQGIVLARLDRLPEAAKLTLKVASVIGSVFDYELLAAAHPQVTSAGALPEQVDLLLARDFARIETPEPRLRFVFKHNITQEVTYQTLLEDQRHELHLAVAEVIERLQPGQIEDLAYHFSHSNLQRRAIRDRALHYLDAAGQRAKRDYANETALHYFNRALALEERWPWLKAKIEILHILGRRAEEADLLDRLAAVPNAARFETALLRATYLEAISDYEAATVASEQALQLSRAIGDQPGELRALAFLGQIARRYGHYDQANAQYTTALRLAQITNAPDSERGELLYGLGIVDRQQGRYEEAQAQLTQALDLYQQSGNRQGTAKTLMALGGIAYFQRRYPVALDYYQQALDIYRQIGDRAGEGSGLVSLSQILRSLGDHGQAVVVLQQAIIIQQALNNQWWENGIWNELGVIYMSVGDWQQARTCLERGLAIARAIGDEAGQAVILLNLGQVLRDLGDLYTAEEVLQKGLQLATDQKDKELSAQCWSDLAINYLRQQNYPQAIAYAQTALQFLREMDLLLSTTTDLTTLADSYLASGDPSQALAYAQEALQILDDCGGEGPDYPQRDYWICHRVLTAAGETELARHALQAAYDLLQAKAAKINDPAMRRSYLEQVAFNRAILVAAQAEGIAFIKQQRM